MEFKVKWIFLLSCVGFCLCTKSLHTKILNEISNPETYDKLERPKPLEDGPVEVTVHSYILSVNYIDDKKELMELETYFRMTWVDNRLAFNKSGDYQIPFISLPETNSIWMPDVFFSNEHKAYLHNIINPNTFTRIYANGTVLTSRRLTLSLRCPMDLSKFPFDEQRCPWRIESYGYTANDVIFRWKLEDPVQISTSLRSSMPLTSINVNKETIVTVSSGSYSVLSASFTFKRDNYYYLIRIYIPCMMMVIVSWLSFWVSSTKVTTRVVIGVATLYTMSITINNFSDQFGKVSYAKALDVYTGVCLLFVFLTLLESVLVHFKPSKFFSGSKKTGEDLEQGESAIKKKDKLKLLPQWLPSYSEITDGCDSVCRILFPALFLVFNIIYFIMY